MYHYDLEDAYIFQQTRSTKFWPAICCTYTNTIQNIHTGVLASCSHRQYTVHAPAIFADDYDLGYIFLYKWNNTHDLNGEPIDGWPGTSGVPTSKIYNWAIKLLFCRLLHSYDRIRFPTSSPLPLASHNTRGMPERCNYAQTMIGVRTVLRLPTDVVLCFVEEQPVICHGLGDKRSDQVCALWAIYYNVWM